jgi:hypothetical protein
VEKNRSLTSTYCSFSFGTFTDVRGDRPPQMEPISFTPRPVVTSGGQIELGTKPSNPDVHITFDYMLEPGDAGMDTGGGGSSKVWSAVP